MQGRGVVYIDRAKIDYYARGMSSVLTLPVPNTISSNMEIIDRDGLSKLVKASIDQNKLTPSLIHFVLSSSILFEKNFDTEKTPNIEEEIKSFLEIVPFENYLTKRLTTGNITKVVVVNADFVTAYKDIFESFGFQLDSIVLHFEINPSAPSLTTLSSSDIALIMNRFDALRQLSIIQIDTQGASTTNTLDMTINKPFSKKSNTLPLLVGVFVVLIGVLIFLLLRQ